MCLLLAFQLTKYGLELYLVFSEVQGKENIFKRSVHKVHEHLKCFFNEEILEKELSD